MSIFYEIEFAKYILPYLSAKARLNSSDSSVKESKKDLPDDDWCPEAR